MPRVSYDHAHTPEAILKRIEAEPQHGSLGDFVLGSIDGTITTFAIVAGVAGANLSAGIALVLGLANVLADGFSMAVGNYLKASSDREMLARYRRIEEQHIDRHPEGEREEIRHIFAAKGFEGELLDRVVEVIEKDRQVWINTMLAEEWGILPATPSPFKAGAVTFVAFVLAGLVPLSPLGFATRLGPDTTFTLSAVATAITFAVIGAVRGKIAERSAWRAALETLAMGGAAAALSFGVGTYLRGLVGN
jgi:vacuolar iron transporter family protein